MGCDWVARVEFKVECVENGTLTEYIVADPHVVPVWFSHCYDCVQDEINEWKRRSPDTCIYADGKWITDDNNIVFSTAEWGGFRTGTRSHTYKKSNIIGLLGEKDFIKITAIPIGVQYY
jgi:hypothetical protein